MGVGYVPQGEEELEKIYTTLGANGAGKTTLFNVITGRVLTQKRKKFFGEDITRMPV